MSCASAVQFILNHFKTTVIKLCVYFDNLNSIVSSSADSAFDKFVYDNLHNESGWCVAYAIAGRVDIDFETEPLATVDGKVSMSKLLSLIKFFYLLK